VSAEQGVGDQILFCSMIKDMQSLCRDLIVQADGRLLGLLARSFTGNIRFIDELNMPHAALFDYHITMGDLGKYLRFEKYHFRDSAGGYLLADKARTKDLRNVLADNCSGKIYGLSWHSSGECYSNRKKSIPLELLLSPLVKQRRIFVSLQYGNFSGEIRQARSCLGANIKEVSSVDNASDLDGLASLICACDEVITISNTTAHLCGALGVPTHLLVPASPLWYWGNRGNRSIWYKSITLYRQRNISDWSGVAADLSKALDVPD
jgi:hypothetical protein